MIRKPYWPTARETNWLLIVGFLSLGYAMYLRYLAIEQSTIGVACDGGLATWLCSTRRVVSTLFTHSVFGWVAIVAAALHFIRPQIFLLTVALSAAAFGLVLYNAPLSALAVAILILAFARPQLVEE